MLTRSTLKKKSDSELLQQKNMASAAKVKRTPMGVAMEVLEDKTDKDEDDDRCGLSLKAFDQVVKQLDIHPSTSTSMVVPLTSKDDDTRTKRFHLKRKGQVLFKVDRNPTTTTYPKFGHLGLWQCPDRSVWNAVVPKEGDASQYILTMSAVDYLCSLCRSKQDDFNFRRFYEHFGKMGYTLLNSGANVAKKLLDLGKVRAIQHGFEHLAPPPDLILPVDAVSTLKAATTTSVASTGQSDVLAILQAMNEDRTRNDKQFAQFAQFTQSGQSM